eukprot:MONOS_12082.1-p1 / transcript=MONOS_12082.1 / gene=MONOS_12082 / organism=Monocercomonoides_exilis_PA203 / gene_product=unspecified product / transcript_product=unspecified product / location=Mono_scaffold00643:20742-23043(+) / protein_length=712 / sequence_SO=supercontig / SO=protein_coding / is_pseudo=false
MNEGDPIFMLDTLCVLCYHLICPTFRKDEILTMFSRDLSTSIMKHDFAAYVLGIFAFPSLHLLKYLCARAYLIAIAWTIGKLNTFDVDRQISKIECSSNENELDIESLTFLPQSMKQLLLAAKLKEEEIIKELSPAIERIEDSAFLPQSHFIHHLLGKINRSINRIMQLNCDQILNIGQTARVQEKRRKQIQSGKHVHNQGESQSQTTTASISSSSSSSSASSLAATTATSDTTQNTLLSASSAFKQALNEYVLCSANPITLTPGDLQILRTPALLEKRVRRKEKETEQKEESVNKEQLERDFWVWMESVVEKETGICPGEGLREAEREMEKEQERIRRRREQISSWDEESQEKGVLEAAAEMKEDKAENDAKEDFRASAVRFVEEAGDRANATLKQAKQLVEMICGTKGITETSVNAVTKQLNAMVNKIVEEIEKTRRRYSIAELAQMDRQSRGASKRSGGWSGSGSDPDDNAQYEPIPLEETYQATFENSAEEIKAYADAMKRQCVVKREHWKDQDVHSAASGAKKTSLSINYPPMVTEEELVRVESSLRKFHGMLLQRTMPVYRMMNTSLAGWVSASAAISRLSAAQMLSEQEKSKALVVRKQNAAPFVLVWKNTRCDGMSLRQKAAQRAKLIEEEGERRKEEMKEEKRTRLRQRMEMREKKRKDKERELEERILRGETELVKKKSARTHAMVAKWFGKDDSQTGNLT